MNSGRLKIAARCNKWKEELLNYYREDGLIVKTNDDLLSATRVGIMQLRCERPVALGSMQ